MPFSEQYRNQTALLVRALPFVATQDCFALKGGTAINLFIRDLPRLSVDIDLTYVPVQARSASLSAIDTAMKHIAAVTQNMFSPEIVVTEIPNEEGAVTKLVIRNGNIQIKIEVTPVLRGCVFDPTMRTVSTSVEEAFGFAEMRVMSFADLYAGKILAALDRQHPRDLFDMHGLLANEGIDDNLRRAFIVYLLSHNRPMHEIIATRRKNINLELERSFMGMTDQPVEINDLLAARENTIKTVVDDMPDKHRQLLITFEQGNPDWSLLGLSHVANLPAIRWRQENLEKLNQTIRAKLVDDLKRSLGL